MKFKVFSYTPNKVSKNSAELHECEFHGDEDGRVVKEVTRELKQNGHQVVDVWRVREGQRGEQR